MGNKGLSLEKWCKENGEFGQQIISEWTGIGDDEENNYKIDEITYASNIKLIWKCSNGHTWSANPAHRTYCKTMCPYCNQRRYHNRQKLNEWCMQNKEYGSIIESEWTGLCFDDNKQYEMSKITPGSKRHFIWRCKNGHEWNATICSRITYKTRCAKCNGSGTSYPEQFIYWALKQVYPNTISRGKYKGIEFDITIPEERTCIEYSPTRWHNGKEEIDNYKAELCKSHNINFIYIKEDTDNEYNEQWTNNYICFHMSKNNTVNKDNDCIKLVKYILNIFGKSISEIDIDNVKRNAFDYSYGKVEYKDSLAACYPDLAKEWHKTLNNETPDKYTKRSSKTVYWQCNKCNYGSKGEWISSIHNRTHKNQYCSCPACGYSWKDGKYHTHSIRNIIDQPQNNIFGQYNL